MTAADDLDASLYSAVMGAVAGWHLVVIVGIVTSPTDLSPVLLVALHGALAGLAALGIRSRAFGAAAWVATLASASVGLVANVSIDDPFTFTTIWMTNLLILGPALVLPGWRGTTLGVLTVAYAATIYRVLQPTWDVLHGTMITTGLAMVVAGTLLTRYLRRFAEAADAQIAAAETAQVALGVAGTAGRSAAQLARTMHDTAVNTLSAIVSGGSATADVEQVRDRCARDVETLRAVLDGSRAVDEPHDLAAVGADAAGIAVERTGPTDQERERLLADVPVHVRRALRSAADEAVRNAARHSGAARVDVSVRFDQRVEIEVVDAGVGFDPTDGFGRGLSESVIGRVADIGADAQIVSRPGDGTRVVIRWEPEQADTAHDDSADDAVVEDGSLAEGVRQWACWAWAAGVVGVGFPIEYAARPGVFTWNYPALALVGIASAASWWIIRRHAGRLPRWWAWVLVAAIPVAFVLGYLGIKDDPYLWQAISVTPLAVIMLVYRRVRELWAALAVMVVTVAVVAVVAADGDASRAGIVVVGAAPQIGLVLGWSVFHRVVGEVAHESDLARRRATDSRAAMASRRAADAVRDRWRQAEAEEAVAVLSSLASGELDPRDDAVRQRCRTVEHALRQIMQLSPDAIYLGPSISAAMSAARERGIELDVRTGDVDASDLRQAEILGAIMAATVDAVDPRESVTIGVFGDEHAGRLLLVTRRPIPVPEVPSGWLTTAQELGDQRLVEIVWPRAVTVVT